MRKRVIVVLLFLLVLAVGGYCVSWFVQAGHIKKQVEQAVAKINEKQTYITYESLEVSGFPSTMAVIMTNPRFAGRIDVLLKSLAEGAPAGADGSVPPANMQALEKLPEWNEDTALEGTLTLSINALSDRYSLVSRGNWHSQPTIEGQKLALTSKMNGEMACFLQMERSNGMIGSLWSMSLARDGKQFAEDFRSLDCSFPSYTATDNATNELMVQSGGGRFHFSKEPGAVKEQMRLFVKIDNAEITKAGDRWMDLYTRALAPDYPFSREFSAYGKQNIEVDFAYDGPRDFASAGKDAPFDINLVKFMFSNDVYNSTVTLRVTSNSKDGNRNASLALRSDSTFSERYDQELQGLARGFVHEMYKNKELQNPATQAFINRYTQEEAVAIVLPAVPGLNSLGKLVQAINISYQGASDFTEGDVNLSELELSASPYGITGKGTAKLSKGQMFPAANIDLTCSNCLRMVDDMAAYAARVQKVTAYFDRVTSESITIDPQVVEGFKNFLAALSQPATDAADTTTFRYNISSDGMMGITVSGRPMDQVMALYAEHVGAATKPASGEQKTQ